MAAVVFLGRTGPPFPLPVTAVVRDERGPGLPRAPPRPIARRFCASLAGGGVSAQVRSEDAGKGSGVVKLLVGGALTQFRHRPCPPHRVCDPALLARRHPVRAPSLLALLSAVSLSRSTLTRSPFLICLQCTNCAGACKRCDEARPCERCVKYGLAETCIDGVRKERKKGIKRGPYKRKNRSVSGEGTSGACPGHHVPGTYHLRSSQRSALGRRASNSSSPRPHRPRRPGTRCRPRDTPSRTCTRR